MCFFRVSCFLTMVLQQIHSLRASNVSSFHSASKPGLDVSAFRKSAGTLCITPVAIFWAIPMSFQIFYLNFLFRKNHKTLTLQTNEKQCIYTSKSFIALTFSGGTVMVKAMKMEGGVCCSCPNHKWMPGLTLLVTGGVLLYTNSWAYAIMALGALVILGGNLCKCCSGGGMCGCC